MVCQMSFLSFLRWCGYSKVAGSLHLELVHSLAGIGNHDLAAVAVRHDVSLLFHSVFVFRLDGTSAYSIASNVGDIPVCPASYFC